MKREKIFKVGFIVVSVCGIVVLFINKKPVLAATHTIKLASENLPKGFVARTKERIHNYFHKKNNELDKTKLFAVSTLFFLYCTCTYLTIWNPYRPAEPIKREFFDRFLPAIYNEGPLMVADIVSGIQDSIVKVGANVTSEVVANTTLTANNVTLDPKVFNYIFNDVMSEYLLNIGSDYVKNKTSYGYGVFFNERL